MVKEKALLLGICHHHFMKYWNLEIKPYCRDIADRSSSTIYTKNILISLKMHACMHAFLISEVTFKKIEFSSFLGLAPVAFADLYPYLMELSIAPQLLMISLNLKWES